MVSCGSWARLQGSHTDSSSASVLQARILMVVVKALAAVKQFSSWCGVCDTEHGRPGVGAETQGEYALVAISHRVAGAASWGLFLSLLSP